jgi:DNA polymerase-3 subunit beta
MNIKIKADIFAAVSLFRGINDVRYYLNGLLLETGPKGARLVGCDGHQLAVAKIEGEFPVSSIIIPGCLVDVVRKKAKSAQFVTMDFAKGNKQYKDQDNVKGIFVPRDITLNYGETTTTSKELDGKYPDYRRVVPEKTDGTVAQFDPRLVNRIDKACSILGHKFFAGIAHNGDKSGLSVIDEKFIVVTMPFKADPKKVPPAWVTELTRIPRKSSNQTRPMNKLAGAAA